ncbi:MAG: NAD(P)-dependent oxidoreductase [Lachnospiraceae bacterium]|nr:NAD(P)-dependent oxidoreductase [Lachnospiraceae bacterium]
MFQKLVAIEPTSLVDSAVKKLHTFAKEVILYNDIPADNGEIIRRIGDADAVLLSYTSRIDQEVIESCPNIRYIGMCCSLYAPESANVDIRFAESKGITVLGIRDYGDRGVVEFVLSELIRLLHGYDRPMWQDMPVEITGLKVGIIGLGVSGSMLADALSGMGADISYYSRTRKTALEENGYHYADLPSLLAENDVILTCLNKNVILLKEKEFQEMGNGKILFNTSIGPSHEVPALLHWLEAEPDKGTNYFVCDTLGAFGGTESELQAHSNIFCAKASAGRTRQAFDLLSEKVIANIETYFSMK